MSASSSSEETIEERFAPSLDKWLDHIAPERCAFGEPLEPPATPDIFPTGATVAGTACAVRRIPIVSPGRKACG
jgi:hypothetical protein